MGNELASLLDRVERIPGFDCWFWIGCASRCRKGFTPYGVTKILGKKMRTHRVVWELTHGPIPPGMHVCHTCDVTLCVNPAHLFLGTARDNMHDCAKKGRMFDIRSLPPRPRRNRRVTDGKTLTIEQARRIRDGNEQLATLAREFGITRKHAYKVRAGYRWQRLSARREAA